MSSNWINKLEQLPNDQTKEPILVKINSPFKYGLLYKFAEGNKKVWKLSKESTHWKEI